MDTVCHHHDNSIFANYKTGFWSDGYTTSWKNKYVNGDPAQGRKKWFWKINVPVQFTDCFHFFKSLMIIFLIAAIVWYRPLFDWYDFLILGTLWNITFSVFYNVILKK